MYWPLVVIATFSAAPVFAASVACSDTHDPVARTICAHPTILELDSKLSTAYTDALARNPSHADNLRQDEINWLGERNREMWWLLAGQREFPSVPSDVEAGLANFYQTRIAFLRNIDNSAATEGAPIAQELLESTLTLPSRGTDPLEALRSAGTVVLAKDHNAPDVERTIAMLAAPPDAALRAALDRFQPYSYTVEYMPSVGLGGAFNVEGTADCQYWVLFEKQANTTVPVVGGGSLGGCMRDEGSTGYLALINGHPVALTVTNDPALWSVTDFGWRQWLGGNKWGPQRRIRFRYGYRLKLENKVYCPSAVPQCTLTGAIALVAAKHYMRNAMALAQSINDFAAERTHIKQMLQLAPNRKTWANCEYPVWFQAPLDQTIVVGGVAQSHIGCHPDGSSLEVGFWGTQGNGTQWWSADNTVDVDRVGLLSAAVVPATSNPH